MCVARDESGHQLDSSPHLCEHPSATASSSAALVPAPDLGRNIACEWRTHECYGGPRLGARQVGLRLRERGRRDLLVELAPALFKNTIARQRPERRSERSRRCHQVGDVRPHESESDSGAKVCVIGQTVATQLFGEGDPLGQVVRVKAMPCECVGVLASKGQSSQGQDQDDLVVDALGDVQVAHEEPGQALRMSRVGSRQA